jgi:hypothetical protein
MDRGLVEVALCGGNTHLAYRNLKAQGIEIPRRTLYSWATENQVERYQRLRVELAPRIAAKIAAECEDTAELAGRVERGMLAQFEKDYSKLEPRDQAGAIRNVSTTKGINIDKAALLRGQPTEIVGHRHDVGELWSEFAAMFPSVVVEAEAEEITDADVVPGADPGAGSALEAGPPESPESAPEA